jgi:hypothetical protein
MSTPLFCILGEQLDVLNALIVPALPVCCSPIVAVRRALYSVRDGGTTAAGSPGTQAGSSMQRLWWLCLAFIFVTIALSALAQQKEPRLALVIGNASYPDASTPLSSSKDARSLAQEFRRNSFEVDLKENAGRAFGHCRCGIVFTSLLH